MAHKGVLAAATVVLVLMVHVAPFTQGRAHVHVNNMGSIGGAGLVNDRVLMKGVDDALAQSGAAVPMDGYGAPPRPFNITIGLTCHIICEYQQPCKFDCKVHR